MLPFATSTFAHFITFWSTSNFSYWWALRTSFSPGPLSASYRRRHFVPMSFLCKVSVTIPCVNSISIWCNATLQTPTQMEHFNNLKGLYVLPIVHRFTSRHLFQHPLRTTSTQSLACTSWHISCRQVWRDQGQQTSRQPLADTILMLTVCISLANSAATLQEAYVPITAGTGWNGRWESQLLKWFWLSLAFLNDPSSPSFPSVPFPTS